MPLCFKIVLMILFSRHAKVLIPNFIPHAQLQTMALYDQYLHKTETFEFDSTKNFNYAASCNDTSTVINNLPTVNITEAIKNFNQFEIVNNSVIRKESPQEKLNRIKNEIKELEVHYSDLEGVDSLSQDLELALKISEDNKKTRSGVKKSDAEADATSGNFITKKPKHENLNLENRITKLEQALGKDTLNSFNLFRQVENLNRKLSLLDHNNIKNLENKIGNISGKLQNLSKHTLNENQLGKLNEMEKLCVHLSESIPVIPELTNRLESLKEVLERVGRKLLTASNLLA